MVPGLGYPDIREAPFIRVHERWYGDDPHDGTLEEIAAPRAEEPVDLVPRLIRRLPDCRGRCYSCFPGYVELADGGPAAELTRLGAVPGLLGAWEDSRPSRSLSFHHGWKGWMREWVTVVPVGDHARAILEEIAGRELRERADAIAWFEEVRTHGERAVLARQVQAGGPDAARSASRLKERHPDAAQAAILEGIGNATEEWARDNLVLALRDLRTEATTRFLRAELAARDVDRRIRAAWLLLGRGMRDGIPAVTDAWVRGEGGDGLTELLALCGSAEAVAALGSRFDGSPVGERVGIALLLLDSRSSWRYPDLEIPKPDPGWAAAVEKLLVHALEDQQVAAGTSAWSSTYCFTEPRVCDVAACALEARFPDRFHFDPDASIRRRDRQILVLRNVWRARSGLPPLPVPEEPRAPSIDAGEARRLRAAFRRDHDTQAIERHGIAALPAVREWLDALAADDPARKPLEEVVRRLACRVTVVEAPEEAREILGKLKDWPLGSADLVTAVVELTSTLPKATRRFTLTAGRDAGEPGVALRLEPKSGSRDAAGCGIAISLRVRGREQMGLSSSADGRSREHWDELEWRLAEVLSGDPATPFEARLRVDR